MGIGWLHGISLEVCDLGDSHSELSAVWKAYLMREGPVRDHTCPARLRGCWLHSGFCGAATSPPQNGPLVKKLVPARRTTSCLEKPPNLPCACAEGWLWIRLGLSQPVPSKGRQLTQPPPAPSSTADRHQEGTAHKDKNMRTGFMELSMLP